MSTQPTPTQQSHAERKNVIKAACRTGKNNMNTNIIEARVFGPLTNPHAERAAETATKLFEDCHGFETSKEVADAITAIIARACQASVEEHQNILAQCVHQIEHLEWLRAHDNGPIPSSTTEYTVKQARALLARNTNQQDTK